MALCLKGSAGRLFCSHLRSWEVAADWQLGRESPGGSLKCWYSWVSLRTVLSCGLSRRTVHLTAVQVSPVPLQAEPRTGAASLLHLPGQFSLRTSPDLRSGKYAPLSSSCDKELVAILIHHKPPIPRRILELGRFWDLGWNPGIATFSEFLFSHL